MSRLFLLALAALPLLSASALAEFPKPYDSEKADSKPLSPEAAASQWKLPEGFKATVFASEPDVQQPIAMALDGRGRLWVAECYTYAEHRVGFAKDLKDRIVILEDTDGDGRHDKRTVFYENLSQLSSVEIGFGGVWVVASPQVLFIPDRDGDDRPDGEPQVVLDGFEYVRNHHTIANGLRWGPDGWLYGRHGIQADSAIGKPGTPNDQRLHMNVGIWRYHPKRGTVERVAEGTTNPWGMDWNAHGEAFFINTVIGHLWHVIPGAHYRRMYGADANPYLYELIEQHADHVHWAAGEAWNDWQKLGTTDGTSAAGGGHAHTGLMIYGGDNWPESWRGKLLTINFNGRRLNVENLERTGSGYVGKHQPDTGYSADPWFRGIDLIYGADGGVFIADWSDTGECHDDSGVYRQSGRIYKITYGQPKQPTVVDIAKLSPAELVTLLGHKNEFFARQARKRLQELAVSGADLKVTQTALHKAFTQSSDVVQQLRALWALNAIGAADAKFLREQLNHKNENVRTWAIRLLLDDRAVAANDTETLKALVALAQKEPSAFVRLALASALQRLPVTQRAELARPLLKRAEDAGDHNLPQMLWYGIEPLGSSDPAALALLGVECDISLVRRCIARRLTENLAVTDNALSTLLVKAAASDAAWQSDVLTGMSAALKGLREAKPPTAWSSAGPKLAQSPNQGVQDLFRTLGIVFGDKLAFEATHKVVLDKSREVNTRRTALRSLISARAAGLRETAQAVLTTSGLAATAADGLALQDDVAIADFILEKFNAIAPSEKAAVLSTLIARPTWAARVLEAIAAGKVARTELSAFHARQIRGFNDAVLTEKVKQVWGDVRDSSAEKTEQMAVLKKRLTPEVLAQANKAKGREIFATACGTCHVLNGEGRNIGPELTGSARDNLDYLISNVGDPSAVVARDYQLSNITMKDDRVLSGFIRSRSEKKVVLQTMAEALSLPADEIAEVQTSALSMMPDGLLESLSESDVRDLIGYLMTK